MRETYLNVVNVLARLAVGVYFIVAAVNKFQGGLANFVEGPYRRMQPDWLPNWFATPYGYALPFAEMLAGSLLIAGLFTRIVAGVMALMVISFTIVTTIYHPQLPLHPNVVILGVLLLFTGLGGGKISVDNLSGRR